MVSLGYGHLAAALLACGAVLSACGGDGGPSRPGSRIGEAGPESRPPAVRPPGMETAPASVWAASVLGGADALFATGVHEERGFGERQVHDTACSGLACPGTGGGGIGAGNAGRLARAGVAGRMGAIDLVWASDLDAGSWGGWMRHAGFGVLLERAGNRHVGRSLDARVFSGPVHDIPGARTTTVRGNVLEDAGIERERFRRLFGGTTQ